MWDPDDQPANTPPRRPYYIVSDEEMDRVVVPLTVVHAYVQLLRRRVGVGILDGTHGLDDALARMEKATYTMADDLWKIMESTSHPHGHEGWIRKDETVNNLARDDAVGPRGNEHEGGRATPEQMKRKHVYVVNGSPDFLDIVRELLQSEQYNVTTTNFVPRSFEAIGASQPAMLIVDLVAGEQAGWDLLAQLREAASTREIPVLLVSTRPDLLDDVREQHEAFGGDRYLAKPFDLDDLLDAVEQLIGKA